MLFVCTGGGLPRDCRSFDTVTHISAASLSTNKTDHRSFKMTWALVSLLVAALTVESYVVHDQHERLSHGRQLKIYLPKSTEKLEFIPADDPRQILVYWEKGKSSSPIRGQVSGSNNDRRWYLDQVTYDDEGTYIQRDFWNKEMSTLRVAVLQKNNYIKRVAGESLFVSLEGINPNDATLSFSGAYANVTLVRDGALVSQSLPDYFDRVRKRSSNIEILSVNFSDVGHYTLKDRKIRVVSITRMDLTDRHEKTEGNPLLALLLLLGIPAGICCCCRKKIFKSKATTASALQGSPGAVVLPPVGPSGPCPPYTQPQQPGYYPAPSPNMGPTIHPPPPAAGPGQWNGPPPSPGVNPAYPSPNPAYPSPNPGYPNPGYPSPNPAYPSPNAAYPPVNPDPQWNGPPPGQYPPGPAAPMGYAPAPVMYSEPPAKEGIKMENMAPAATDPLLAHPPQGNAFPASAPMPATSFHIDKNSTNFL